MPQSVTVGLNGRDYLGQLAGVVVTVLSGGALASTPGAAADVVTWQIYAGDDAAGASLPVGSPGTATYLSPGAFAFSIPAVTLALFAVGASGRLAVKLVRPSGGSGEWDQLLYFDHSGPAAN